ncbi:hypothetical protein [Paraburkholderia unamae]|uniref:Uncharacterized protein n=1 Tax=Paraburkholderia unamae TaxID=219649 RepID=A0ABX5KAR8_9BURK|nr:hypothetical protein [Paraburkholderia unamae]PVX61260.1 hypothetical protein C7402_14253 [Paraburkholderia unamae]
MIRWLKRLFSQREIRGYQPLPDARCEPPPMPRAKPSREVERLASDMPEPGCIEYRFLGVTGEEEA